MPTFQIHIRGVVQGVGFRPFVYQQAIKKGLNGWVINGSEGVLIQFNATEKLFAKDWLDFLIAHAPILSRIQSATLSETKPEHFKQFSILESSTEGQPAIPLTPDFGMCSDCKSEMTRNENRRYNYAFITCTNCGPRYSITRKVPYDRPVTTMQPFEMCPKCHEEYHDPTNRRHFSQTNSCPQCAVKLSVYDTTQEQSLSFPEEQKKLDFTVSALQCGKIVAVKGIGGYLLLYDAANDATVSLLRKRKHRPKKPFAVLYKDIDRIREAFKVSIEESKALQSPEAPIVLLAPRRETKLSSLVAPGLSTFGIMVPYAPLLYLIASKISSPLIATSGNISGSPIIYKDEEAITELSSIADYIITHDREILIPQDDSVLRFTPRHQQKIILRRSRGIAPNYFGMQPGLKHLDGYLATGAEMKGAFALVHKNYLYVSQYLGNLSAYHSQVSFDQVLEHLKKVLDFSPKKLLSDQHPGYFGFGWCAEKSTEKNWPWVTFQHHKAHFASVLAENDLLNSPENVLGFIWDGTGLSPNHEIWGSETFHWNGENINHLSNIGTVPHFSGNQMARQPRLSLLAFTNEQGEAMDFLKPHFSDSEWLSFSQVKEKSTLATSSMGRLFDAVACLLCGISLNTFEGEAAMQLETLAANGQCELSRDQEWGLQNNVPFHQQVIKYIFSSLAEGMEKPTIAYRFHLFLVQWIRQQAQQANIRKLAFSGGVFQNALLVDLIVDRLSAHYQLYFQKELSPNDENIAHGQLMLARLKEK